MALRIEVNLSREAPPALAEWRVGPEPTLAPPDDLHVESAFALDGEALVWTVSLANPGARDSRSVTSPSRSHSQSARAGAPTSTRRNCFATRS